LFLLNCEPWTIYHGDIKDSDFEEDGQREIAIQPAKPEVLYYLYLLQIKNQVIVTPLDKVRDLGVIIDSKLTMEAHTANVVRSCFYQLRQLRSIRRS